MRGVIRTGFHLELPAAGLRDRGASCWRCALRILTTISGTLLLRGRVGTDFVEQLPVDAFGAGADRPLAGAVDQCRQRPDAARASFTQFVRKIDQHSPVYP